MAQQEKAGNITKHQVSRNTHRREVSNAMSAVRSLPPAARQAEWWRASMSCAYVRSRKRDVNELPLSVRRAMLCSASHNCKKETSC